VTRGRVSKASVVARPDWVQVDVSCQRLPCGRICRILAVNSIGALVKDVGSTTWVSYRTLAKKWRRVPKVFAQVDL